MFWALIALGALLAIASLSSLAMPGVAAAELLTVLFGVLLFIAPWVLAYTGLASASWTSWVVGAIAVVLGGSALPMAQPRAPAGDPALTLLVPNGISPLRLVRPGISARHPSSCCV